MKKVLAVFDFDGTLLKYNSLPFFLWHSVPSWTFIQKTAFSMPFLLKYCLQLLDADAVKERVFTIFFAGMKKEKFAGKARSFSNSIIPNLVRDRAIQRLKWHLDKKHICILVSASVQDYLIPWARDMGFSEVLATRLETDDIGNITGKFSGRNCKGNEKVLRIKERLGDLKKHEIYVYGDSRGDKELLTIADHPFYKSFFQEKAYPNK